jgi:hypothetical protein
MATSPGHRMQSARPRAEAPTLAVARACAALLAGVLLAGCGGGGTADAQGAAPVPTGSPSPLIDGLAIGPERATNPTVFHHLEVAARDLWHTDHPTQPVAGFHLHHAGVLADGTLQAGTDALLTFLVVVDIPDEGPHAMVIGCSPLAVTDITGCEVLRAP